ncbi:hypothetical protein DKM44_02490 [Deinococcus irradiatisoli]|uniref:Lipoprotein n=1 Tax=Deinococcus irradiatisoli TaxID=2202254 RepID=A0A2Z3JAV2_9DEIO|nr:hypothetical protein [Deinococcus irradiatisoli]AWN22243.1 hypothetical protein DKM44_02490 [Deinococcus irradiatisoli]
MFSFRLSGLPLALLPLSALLGACGSAPTPAAPAAAETTPTVSGQLSGAQNTTANLIGSGQTLAVTSVDAQGRFSLTLPGATQLTGVKTSLSEGLLADLGCTGTLNLSDPGAQGYGFATLTSGSGQQYADASVTKTLTTRIVRGRAYLYADRPTTITGPLNCSQATGYPTTVQVDVNASAGWNVVALNITGSLGFGGISVGGTLGNGQLAPGSVWTDVDTLRDQVAP